VDRDGRFTILFTGWLRRMQGGKVAVDGCVRGSDFHRELQAPFGNGCDMMYLSTTLQAGPHLRTLLAHEYTHAVVYSEHVFGDYLPVAARRDEESWLNEGLAHLAEELHGHGWSNLDYRVSGFLNDPGRWGLVVADYYGSGVWRDPGPRGAAYLFLRSCRGHCAELPARLVQSNLQGVLNLEVATQRPFAELFREWAVGLLGAETRRVLGGRLLCGPHFTEVPLDRGRREATVAGTGVAYLLLRSPAARRSRVTVKADADADLQVTLVRVPRGSARLSLRCEPAGDSAVQLIVTAHGGAVRLEGAAWERLVPAGEGTDTSHRAGADPGEAVRAWFGDAQLKAGESRRSEPIALPAASRKVPLVFRVAGTDTHESRPAAWANRAAGSPGR
jgi:hypothetical protein